MIIMINFIIYIVYYEHFIEYFDPAGPVCVAEFLGFVVVCYLFEYFFYEFIVVFLGLLISLAELYNYII